MTPTSVGIGFAFLVVIICAALTISFAYSEIRRKNKELDKKDARITELLNRLQSGDLHTFLSMQLNSGPSTPVAPESHVGMSDAEELARLGKSQGLGYELHDDSEFADTLAEFGIDDFIERPDR